MLLAGMTLANRQLYVGKHGIHVIAGAQRDGTLTSAVSFTELWGDPLTQMVADDSTFFFVVNDTPFDTYGLEFSMISEVAVVPR